MEPTLFQDGLPIRQRGIFAIHAPSYLETVLNILKPVLKEKTRKRVSGFSTLTTSIWFFFFNSHVGLNLEPILVL